MRPVAGYPGVWECPRHGLFAQVIAKEQADEIERGEPFTMHDGTEGVASRTGDERHGGILLYYRPKDS
jgi:hypothetical protein